MKKKRTYAIAGAIVLGLILLIYILPILSLLINSFKPYGEIMDSFIALPKAFTLENYPKAWKALDFIRSSGNSVIMTVITLVLLLGTTMPAAYQLSRSRTKLGKFLFNFFTMPYLIPFFAVMIPVVKLARDFHLNNSLLGVSVVNVGISGSFAIIMFCGFVKSIPRELDEAAYVDGCGKFQVFTKIIVPLLKPAISSVTIVYSLWTWNNFMLPFLMLTDRPKQTLIIRVFDLFGMYGTDWEVVIAALILVSAPIIILYAVFQKYIIGGLTSGAVKG
ncbi:MAG: carbohydrate ABC transporter permease [Pseudoflavonifractor sp.]